MEISNAIITDVYLGIEDHGMLAFGVSFDLGGTHQGTGLYSFAAHKEDCKEGQDTTLLKVYEFLKVMKVDRIEKMIGKTCRIKRTDSGAASIIVAIGDIINDDWYQWRTD